MNETLTLPPGVDVATSADRRVELYHAIAAYLGSDWSGVMSFTVDRGRVKGHQEIRRYGADRITEEGRDG